MTHLHLSLATGVSGDMLLAALLDAGAPRAVLDETVAGLHLPGVSVTQCEKQVASIRTLSVDVVQESPQPMRHYTDIAAVIDAAALPERVKTRSLAALRKLGEAEAKVHATTLDAVHFHEIGAVDTIVDIVGAMALVEHLAPETISASAVNLGSGFVTMAHGTLPVPAPACAELAKEVTTFATDLGAEAATPTGLAVVATLAQTFGELPAGRIRAVGYGSGTRSGEGFPTYVRAFVIEV